MTDLPLGTVLITGAASGIGRALAHEAAARGARVVLCDVDEAGAEDALTDLPGTDRDHRAFACDVADEEQVEALFCQAKTLGAMPDLVVANAGVSAFGALTDQPLADIQWLFRVNVFGCLHVARAAARGWREQGQGGRLLITGSENSLSLPRAVAGLQLGAYNATKHAVLSIADVLRTELVDHGIVVSLLCPGPVPSNLVTAIRRRGQPHGGPGEVRPPEVDRSVLETLASQNVDAADVARMALDGVAEGRFYILTHRHIQDDVKARYTEILDAARALTSD